MTALAYTAHMEPSLATAFYGDGWLYIAYSDGTIARRFMGNGNLTWERVETPEIKNWEVQIPEKPAPSLEKK